jgi:hypothetical protein
MWCLEYIKENWRVSATRLQDRFVTWMRQGVIQYGTFLSEDRDLPCHYLPHPFSLCLRHLKNVTWNAQCKHSHSCCCLVHQLSSWEAGMHHEVSVVALVPRTAAGIMDNFFRCCRWDERLKCNFSGGFLMFQAKKRFGFAYKLKEFPNHLVALIKWLWQRKRREANGMRRQICSEWLQIDDGCTNL